MKTFKEVKQTTLKGISPREGELIITKIEDTNTTKMEIY